MRTTRNATTVIATIGLVFGGLGLLSGCEDGPFENAGEEVDDAVDDAGDALEDAGDDIEEAFDDDGRRP